MVEKKGFIYLIDACRRLRDRGIAFTLDIIGEDGDQTPTITAAIRDSRLQEHVRLLPPVAQRDLVDVYKTATAFVLPCVVLDDGDRDGIPNVMAEAMACALPVVVTNVSGIPELVENDVNGVIVPSRDSEALAHAIEALITDPCRGQRIGRAARQRVEQVFDARHTHDTLKSLFDRVLGQTANAS